MTIKIVNNQYTPATTVARVVMQDGYPRAQVYCGNSKFKKSLESGIYNPAMEIDVTPEDGFAFMEALPYEFKSGYYGIIKEED